LNVQRAVRSAAFGFTAKVAMDALSGVLVPRAVYGRMAEGRQRCRPFFVRSGDHASVESVTMGQAQQDPAASHPQPFRHSHAVALACTAAAAPPWQPHWQPLPGQFEQRQMAWGEFMAFPFLDWRTRRVRGKGFSGRGAPAA